jgi:hypothetical protein
MSDTQLRAPSGPSRAENVTGRVPRLTPPPGWLRSRQGQLAARLAQEHAPRTGQRPLPPRTVGPMGRAYMAAVVARYGDPRQPAADPEPEAGA